MSENPGSTEPMSISDKIKTFARQITSAMRIERLIVLGVIFLIAAMILVIYKMGSMPSGQFNDNVIQKLLDLLNTLLGALICWGTTLITSTASNYRDNNKD